LIRSPPSLQETSWTAPEEVAQVRARAAEDKRKADEEARRAAAQKRAMMQAQADAQMAHHRNLQQWGGGPRGPPTPRPQGGGQMMMAMGGGRMGQYQQMMAFMAQRQEKLQMKRNREELAARFKEMLMDHGVTAYSRWEKELPKLQGDERFKAVTTAKERRALFDHFCCNITSELVRLALVAGGEQQYHRRSLN